MKDKLKGIRRAKHSKNTEGLNKKTIFLTGTQVPYCTVEIIEVATRPLDRKFAPALKITPQYPIEAKPILLGVQGAADLANIANRAVYLHRNTPNERRTS